MSTDRLPQPGEKLTLPPLLFPHPGEKLTDPPLLFPHDGEKLANPLLLLPQDGEKFTFLFPPPKGKFIKIYEIVDFFTVEYEKLL